MQRISLRDRKFARTKLALLNAALERLAGQPLDDIAIKDLCEAAQVSEATFFNYFPRKTDLLVYFIQLWSIEVGWHARRAFRERGSALAGIEAIFDLTARQTGTDPSVMGEIIAYQARRREPPQPAHISVAERYQAFPDLDGIEDLPALGLDVILAEYLEKAAQGGELPPGTDLLVALAGVASVFFGIPLILNCRPPDAPCSPLPFPLGMPLPLNGPTQNAIGAMYRQQLQILWAGLRAVATTPARRGRP